MTFIIYPATDHIVLSFEGIAMKRIPIITILLVMLLVLSGCGTITKEQQLARFINSHVSKIEPLNTRANYAYWDASTTGKAEDYDRYKKLQLEIRQIYSNRREYAFLKTLKESGEIKDARLARQLDKLYYSYLPNQMDPALMKKIVDLDARITEKYNTFRGTIEGKKVTNSDIYKILTTEKDSHKRQLAWRASKQVGDAIVADLIELVKLRNQAVRKLARHTSGGLGFDNYHTFSIVTGEQSVEELDRIFQQLYELTNEPFANYKRELDGILADMYGIKTEDLRPWHYHDPFFQRTPLVFQLDLDTFYKNNDVKELARTFYAGVGLPVDDILARSDLYDREGKNPHAFGFDADRKGDVRILANLNNDERWMETILHELGHAIYSKYHDPNEPYLLREPAHSFTTEAIAVFFGRLSRNADWIHQMLNLPQEDYQKIRKISWEYAQSQQVLFARWALVMYHFEKQLYANPDQDLNSLWWDLIEKYQYVKRPPGPLDAGWASKLHFTVAPCYYHNYMLGELFASQLHHYLVHNVLQRQSDEGVSYVGEKQVGDYIRRKVFAPGALYYWDDMITRATGEPLTPKYFTEEFLK
jgi:peptidyl-dipeptidase A